MKITRKSLIKSLSLKKYLLNRQGFRKDKICTAEYLI